MNFYLPSSLLFWGPFLGNFPTIYSYYRSNHSVSHDLIAPATAVWLVVAKGTWPKLNQLLPALKFWTWDKARIKSVPPYEGWNWDFMLRSYWSQCCSTTSMQVSFTYNPKRSDSNKKTSLSLLQPPKGKSNISQHAGDKGEINHATFTLNSKRFVLENSCTSSMTCGLWRKF